MPSALLLRSKLRTARLGKAALAGALLALGPALRAGAGDSPAGESPFAPGPVSLVGVSVSPRATELCFYTSADKRSRWIGVGETADGIRVVSYDAVRDSAVVTFRGRRTILVLQEAAGLRAEKSPPPAAAAGPAPGQGGSAEKTAAASTAGKAGVADRERKARMLVSDLLEIASEQRQANAAGAAAPAKTGP